MRLTYARKRFDIGWFQLVHVWALALLARNRSKPTARLQCLWLAGDRCLPVYSVRSGLDLFLRAQHYPSGTVAIMSAVSITDMELVARCHGISVITVDVDKDTLGPDNRELERLLIKHQGHVAFVLHVHLFGAQARLRETLLLTRRFGTIFIEDCAQAFDGFRYEGHLRAT